VKVSAAAIATHRGRRNFGGILRQGGGTEQCSYWISPDRSNTFQPEADVPSTGNKSLVSPRIGPTAPQLGISENPPTTPRVILPERNEP
jgi:hypothetical protein